MSRLAPSQRTTRLAAALIALLLPLTGTAQESSTGAERPLRLDYRLGFRAEHSDNIRRTQEVRISETVLAPNLAFVLDSDSTRLLLQAAGDAEYRVYQDDSFSNELFARVGLRADWRILPERLSWAFEDYLGRQPIDAFAIDVPDNQQRTNIFATGPTLALRPSSTTRVLTELRYLDSYAEETADFNSQRVSLAVRALWQQTATSSLAGNIEFADVDFDREGTTIDPYQRLDAYARIDRRGARIEWSADLGASRIDFDGAEGDRSGPLVRLRYGHALNDITRLELLGSRSFSDAVEDLVFSAPRLEDFDLPVGLPRLRGSFLTADPYRETGFSAALSRAGARVFLRADVYWRDQEYLLSTDLDQEVRGLRLALSRALRSNLELSGFAGIDRRDYTAINRDDRETTLGLRLDWRVATNLELEFGIVRDRRESSAVGEDYRDNRVFVGIVYSRL
jgi:hypothetical protein